MFAAFSADILIVESSSYFCSAAVARAVSQITIEKGVAYWRKDQLGLFFISTQLCDSLGSYENDLKWLCSRKTHNWVNLLLTTCMYLNCIDQDLGDWHNSKHPVPRQIKNMHYQCWWFSDQKIGKRGQCSIMWLSLHFKITRNVGRLGNCMYGIKYCCDKLQELDYFF